MTVDRRRSFRARCDLAVTWRRGGRSIALSAVDFSARGLFVLTDADVDVQFVMDLVIHLPSGPIEVFGVARYVGDRGLGRGVGVALMSMDPEETERWWAYYRQATATAAPAVRLKLAG
jgi:hypothetical protein